MGDDNFLITIGVVLVFPFVFYFLKVWLFATGTPGSTSHRVRRIAEMNGHLSFDERLAEKLREVGEEAANSPEPPAPVEPSQSTSAPFAAPPLAPKGFGRRGV